MAMEAYPSKKAAQVQWLRGWYASHGIAHIEAELIGSRAEKEGCRAAIPSLWRMA
jgi:hypothetical protein